MNVDDHHNGGSAADPESVKGNGHGVLNEVAERTTAPVRSRWSPKPEQILILESIFNSGMVNPSKDETVRIRKLLERFGSVGDANVFYWFQNRRSRTRRRQRQMQSGIQAVIRDNKSDFQIEQATIQYPHATVCSSSSSTPSLSSSFSLHPALAVPASVSASINASNSASPPTGTVPVNELDLYSRQIGLQHIDPSLLVPSILMPSASSSAHYQSEIITVFINGVIAEIPRGSLNMRALFGEDLILVHSSGDPVLVDGYGVSLQGLQAGENYFLKSVKGEAWPQVNIRPAAPQTKYESTRYPGQLEEMG